MKQIYRLEIVAQEEDYDRVCGLLALEVSFGWEEENLPSGETRFRIHCEQEDYLQALQERVRHAVPEARQTLSAIEEKDWVESGYMEQLFQLQLDYMKGQDQVDDSVRVTDYVRLDLIAQALETQ